MSTSTGSAARKKGPPLASRNVKGWVALNGRAVAARAERIRSISADPAGVIPRADMVVVLVPACAHAAVLRRIGPYLSEATVLGCMPTRGGFEFETARAGVRRTRNHPTIFGLQTLPRSTRVTTVGQRVHVGAVKHEALLAALPASDAAPIARKVARILGIRVIPTQSFLGMTVGNPGEFIHPGLMYGHFRGWSGEEYDEDSIPMLYPAATDEMGELVERLSREAVAIADRIDQWTGGVLSPSGCRRAHPRLATESLLACDLGHQHSGRMFQNRPDPVAQGANG
jgi:hypothetical protein